MQNDELLPILVAAAAAQELAAATTVAAQEEIRNVNGTFRSHILAENERLQDVSKEILGLRAYNERLKVRAEFAIIGDTLLIVGSIGFGFLGTTYGQKIVEKTFENPEQANIFFICLSVALLTSAIIGFGLKMFQWSRQISGK